MTKHYSEEFKKYAVKYFMALKQEGCVVYDGQEITTITKLREALDVSLDSLYTWVKKAGINTDGKKPETEKDLMKKFESGQISKAQQEALMPDLEYKNYQWKWDSEDIDFLKGNKDNSDMFGIRYYAWLGRVMGIPNYHSLSLAQLKLKIGLRLIKQSGLVKMVGDK